MKEKVSVIEKKENPFVMGMYTKNTGWFIIVIVIILLALSMFVITSSWYALSIFTKNGELYALNSEAENILSNQRIFFQNVLINTNSDGDGYTTNGASKADENNDDDDFNGEIYDTDGIPDDDGTAFKYKFGFVLPYKEENILFINKKYTDITGFSASSLSGFNLFLDKNANCFVEIYDGNIYQETGNFVLKTRKMFPLQSSKNFIPISPMNILSNDIIMLFISNQSHETLSYSLEGVDLQGADIAKFMPAKLTDRNVDIYTNTILKDNNGQYIVFDTVFYDILPRGKRPVSPTYLHIKNSTGTTLELEWDINEKTSTGAYYLYRWLDSSLDCKEQNFFQKIPNGYKEDMVTIEYNSGIYYYVLCGSNSPWSWSGMEDIWQLSLRSNILQVIK